MALLRQAQEMKKTLDQAQADLEQLTVTGSAAGGMVTVEATGLGTVKRIKIDRSIVNPDEIEMLEDLVVVAVAEAQRKAQDEQKLRAPKLPDGMKLPF